MVRILVLAGALLLAATVARAGQVLTVGLNDGGVFPYILGQGSQLREPPGLAVDVLREVGQRLELEVRFVRMPGQRVLHALKGGSIDAALMFSHSAERQEYGAYPVRDGQPDAARRLATLSYTLYRRRESKLDWDGREFRNLDGPIGASLHYSVVRDLQRMAVQVVEVPSVAEAFRMLQAGRIAGVADHGVVADAHIAAAGITGIDKISPSLSDKDYFLMLSHQYVSADPNVAERIWDAIAEVRDQVIEARSPLYTAPPGSTP